MKSTERWVWRRKSGSYRFFLKASCSELQSKENEFSIRRNVIWWMVLLLSWGRSCCSSWKEGAWWAADALPGGHGNWKCSRTSCSWENFCLVVCALETWLPAFLRRPLDPGKAACVSVLVCVLAWLWFCVVCGCGSCSACPARACPRALC